jgi:hypothetical protein
VASWPGRGMRRGCGVQPAQEEPSEIGTTRRTAVASRNLPDARGQVRASGGRLPRRRGGSGRAGQVGGSSVSSLCRRGG